MTNPADEPRKQALPRAKDLLALPRRPTNAITHSAWSEARETALALVTAGPAMIVVLGPPGTGKTALLRDLTATFGERGRSACLLDFGDSPFDVGTAEIVLVDEADRMSAARLDELRSRGDVAIILAALPAGEERFMHAPDVTVVRLSPLSPHEARAFLVERLAQLGLPNDCLTEAAWTQLITSGRGVPRLLLILLGLALFIAGEAQAERVTDVHVEQALEAKSGSAEATMVEPTRAEADLARQDVLEISAKVESASADPVFDWVEGTLPPRWLSRLVATAAVAAYLVSVTALVTWGTYRLMDGTASHGLDEPTVLSPAATAIGTGTALLEVAPSLPPDRSTMLKGGATSTYQVASATAQPTELDEKFASRTSNTAILDTERDRLQSQVNGLSSEFEERSRRFAGVRGPVAKTENPIVAPHHATPPGPPRPLRPVAHRNLSAIPLLTTARKTPSAVQQLLSARKALMDHKSPEARDLLEAAQTSIVFEPQNTVSEHAGVAAARIGEALSMLNSGDAVSALPYLDRAIAAIQPKL